jgi:hypothetical protein
MTSHMSIISKGPQPASRHFFLQSKQLLIESRWVSKPLAFASKLRPRRLNN